MFDFLKHWNSLPARVSEPELLDMGEGTPDEVRGNLDDMAHVNRWLGGEAALRRFLLPRIRAASRHQAQLRVLDLACGAAYAPLFLAGWARQQNIKLQITALDVTMRHLRIARERTKAFPEISILAGDARELPVQDHAFDFIISSLFLHHLDPADLTATLRGLQRICRGSIILNDLVRSATAHFFFKHGAPLIYTNRLTIHDGLVSIRQAYTPAEIREIVRAAGLAQAKVHHHGLYRRMTLVVDPNAERTPGS